MGIPLTPSSLQAFQPIVIAPLAGLDPQPPFPEEEPEPTHRTPDYSHYLMGWRLWTIRPFSTLLESYFSAYGEWPTGKTHQAECFFLSSSRYFLSFPKHKTSPPYRYCGCGIYAFKSPMSFVPSDIYGPLYVYGKVALWGKILEHTGGYRAQYAYPLELWVIKQDSFGERILLFIIHDHMKRVARQYGVPVHVITKSKFLQEVCR